MKPCYVYIICNKPFGTIYVDSTDDIGRRIYEHREGLFRGFSKTYGLKTLVGTRPSKRARLPSLASGNSRSGTATGNFG